MTFNIGDLVQVVDYSVYRLCGKEGRVTDKMGGDMHVVFEDGTTRWFYPRSLKLIEPAPTTDKSVDHPDHYTWLPNGIEAIDITERFNFCMGNALKYIIRADHKGNPIQDLEKAVWYLERELANRRNS